MPRSRLERKLVVGILSLFLIPTVLAGGVLLYLVYRRGAFEDPSALALTVVIGFVAMMAYLAVMAQSIGRSLVGTLLDIQRGTELMATVNPDHRHRVRTGDELESVAEEINRMADRLRDARRGLEAEVARATHDLHEERAKLSAILAEVDEGVVVATAEGRVTLANPAARALLGGGWLGQSLFDVVDQEKVVHFRDRLQTGPATAERFTLRAPGGALLEAGMTSLVGPEGTMTGFILALRDVSRPAGEHEARQRRLDDAVRELRGSLASIRSLSESLLGDAAVSGTPAGPLLMAIHSEAVRLSSLVVDLAGASPLGLARAPWHFEAITVGDLLRMSVRRVKADGGEVAAVDVADAAPDLPPLRAEVSALSLALAHLLRSILSRGEPPARAWLTPLRRGGVLQIEVGAERRGPADLEAQLDVPLGVGSVGALTVREIVQRHAGEVWAYSDGARAGFWLTLPLPEGTLSPPPWSGSAGPGLRFVGAGLLSGGGVGGAEPERPQLYDFSIFDQMERRVPASDRARALRELSYVVLDAETTGLRPEAGDRIVSLAGVKVRGGVVRRGEFFDALVNPGRPVPASSVRFHGITDGMLVDVPPIDTVLPAFERFAEGAVLVGHEVWFDLQFLARDADRIGLVPPALAHPVLDARLLSLVVHGSTSEHTLEAVAGRLGVTIRGRHSALGDALATAEIFVRLLGLLEKRGVVTLGEALDAARAARGRGPGSRDPGGMPA